MHPLFTFILLGILIILGGLVLYGNTTPYPFKKPKLPHFSTQLEQPIPRP